MTLVIAHKAGVRHSIAQAGDAQSPLAVRPGFSGGRVHPPRRPRPHADRLVGVVWDHITKRSRCVLFSEVRVLLKGGNAAGTRCWLQQLHPT
jgi:hypothetical protein